MGAADIRDALHQTRIHCTPHLKALDFSHLNSSPSVPLMLSLLHASSVSMEQDESFFLFFFFTLHERLALQQGADKWIPSEQSITIYHSSEADDEVGALIVAACLCNFLHVMLIRTAYPDKWSPDYISHDFRDSKSCSFA